MSRMPARPGIYRPALALSLCSSLLGMAFSPQAPAADFPVSSTQRATAQQVAQTGVPLAELASGAPDSYTVKRGDTLWDISKLFLTSPWRWPELWGMNLEQIRNPHLIYPGQLLVLVKSDGRARLTLGRAVGVQPTEEGRLSPRVRSEPLANDAIASVPMHLIGPFLSDAVVFDSDALLQAPRIVATQEGRVMVSRGEIAYVRGDTSSASAWQLFREPKPLLDPDTQEVLGFEARHVGTAEFLAPGQEGGERGITPATIRITQLREEAGVGDRLAPLPGRDVSPFAPHSPNNPVNGRLISVYGDGLNAGQNQIVSINRGQRDGMERGHVLALWRAGAERMDSTDADRVMMRLPDERNGVLFVFKVFDRVSYALILSALDPVKAGDRFTQP
jgi:LysM repeat protein